jgi:hypothetical protein
VGVEKKGTDEKAKSRADVATFYTRERAIGELPKSSALLSVKPGKRAA